LVHHLLFAGVDYLHLIAGIHIELVHEPVIKADKESILVESSLRVTSGPVQMKKNFIKFHTSPVWNVRQRNIQVTHSPGSKAGAFRMVYRSLFQLGAAYNFYEWKRHNFR